MTILRFALLATVAQLAAGADVLQVGGIIQNSGTGARGKAAFEAWRDYVNGASLGYTVNLTWFWTGASDASLNYTTKVASMLSTAMPLNALICPYTTGSSKKMIDAVPAGNMIPIIVWGGATDSIFSVNCLNRKCFGTLTKASMYTTPSLDAVLAKQSSFTIALITNNNGFSRGVTTGTKTWITDHSANVTLAKEVSLSVAKTALSTADKALVDEVIAAAPDVVAVSAHGGDVEDIVMRLRSHATYKAKAIIATNAFTNLETYKTANMANLLVGVVMPDQWAQDATSTDTITHWTTASFKAAMTAAGVTPSYHAASAGGAAIAMSVAMAAGTAGSKAANVGSNMPSAQGVQSFYGMLAFAADGSITKPMYGRQWVNCTSSAVLPPSSSLVYPMPNPPAGQAFQCKAASSSATTGGSGAATTGGSSGNTTGNTTSAATTASSASTGTSASSAQERTMSVFLMSLAAFWAIFA